MRTHGNILPLLLVALVVLAGIAPPAWAQRTLTVGPEGPFRTVTGALESAEDGDRIEVGPGTYREGTISIDKSIEIIGEGWPVIDGEGEHEVINVTANNVTIRGLDIRNAGISFVRDNAGIKFRGVRGAIIRGNRLQDNFFGIYLADTRYALIADNEVYASGTREANTGNGIHLWKSEHVTMEGNRISGHRDGIYLEFVGHANVRGNTSYGNLRYGLHFMFSNHCRYEQNTFRRNGAGVAVMYTNNVEMVANRFEDNWGPAAYGLLLKDISDSRIRGNTFVRNTIAIHSEGSSRMEIHRNHFERNGWAVKIMSNSQNNVFSDNNFIENTFDVATNARRNPNTFTGNYWSRYDGYDLTGDGRGDVPHRPVRLYSIMVEQHPASMILLRSFFVDLLDLAEKVIPALTPETLIDEQPRMREIR